jgi:hypothetical protein
VKRAVLLLWCACSAAQPSAPAAPLAAPSENPAVDTLKAKQPPAHAAGEAGTTIVGEQDSDVGLYLTPWKEEHADNIDPPPGLFNQAPQPVDARRFSRMVRDSVSVDAYRRQQMDPNR